MIPLHLHISGFLSYRDAVELDFSSFDLACISGQNGAGKSSLLDSITWVLFGEARGKSMDIINLNQDVRAAEVTLTFMYEGNIYRAHRSLPRGKSAVLEFQVKGDPVRLAEGSERSERDEGNWKPLTEKTTRETQARIEQILRLDYETFINASFFLQGKADQFTQKSASERKAVLSTILGLEIWDTYKERTAEKRKTLENNVLEIEGRTAEIDAELSEEEARKGRLAEIENMLGQLSATRAAQESTLENIKRNAALLDEQKKLAEALSASLERSRSALANLERRLTEKEADSTEFSALLDRAAEIDPAYKAWQNVRKELEEWEKTALKFREHDKGRAPLLEQIAAEKARLEEERRALTHEKEEIEGQQGSVNSLNAEVEKAGQLLGAAEATIRQHLEMVESRNQAREKQAGLKAENDSLRKEMDEFKVRIEALEKTHDAKCPLCGQELSESHRKSTLRELNKQGKEKGDRFRSNRREFEETEKLIVNYETEITKMAGAEGDRLKYSNTITQLTERIKTLQSIAKEWEKTGKKRLADVTRKLEKELYAVEARKQLNKFDKELARLGYDASEHDAKRKEELELRRADEDHRRLDSARQVLKQIADEITNLKSEIASRRVEITEQEKSHAKAAQALGDSESQIPDLRDAEMKLYELREEENRTRDEAGAARQKVDVLSRLRARKAEYELQREEINQQVVRYRALERAFGKDGVPALLIEQALPQIETKANDLLERLSDGQMSIRFITQAEYKDKKRDDLKETLDIQISDTAGTRDYEMYSGGEAFRVNFAIRLALSEILAQRKGARLQTLVIDEGFGSQDTQGRQRLIEAINLVKGDFAKILIITHLDELKDAFPNRIEVEKTERGSVLRVI